MFYFSHSTAFLVKWEKNELFLEWIKRTKQKKTNKTSTDKHFMAEAFYILIYYQMLKCWGRNNTNFIAQIMKLTLRRAMEFIRHHRSNKWLRGDSNQIAWMQSLCPLHRAARNCKSHLLSAEHPTDVETVRLEADVQAECLCNKISERYFSVSKEAGDGTKWPQTHALGGESTLLACKRRGFVPEEFVKNSNSSRFPHCPLLAGIGKCCTDIWNHLRSYTFFLTYALMLFLETWVQNAASVDSFWFTWINLGINGKWSLLRVPGIASWTCKL